MYVFRCSGRAWAVFLLGSCLFSSADMAQAQAQRPQSLEPVQIRGPYLPSPSGPSDQGDLSYLDGGDAQENCWADSNSAEGNCSFAERSVKEPTRLETLKEERDRIRKAIEERRKERKATCNKIFDVMAAQAGQRAQAERAACENTWSVGSGIGAIAKGLGIELDIKWLSSKEACTERAAQRQKDDMTSAIDKLHECEQQADAQAALELAQQGLSG